jgi:signal transduction histidine kinase/CheY-like chemotaxis protein
VTLVIVFIIYTIKNISESLIELKNVAKSISFGKTGNTISFHSNDVIGSLAESILLVDAHKVELARAADEIGKGNFEVEVVVRSAEDKLGHAIKRMKDDLQRYVNENEEELWIRDGITAINESTRGEKEMSRLCKDALDVFVENASAQVGVFYTAREERLYFSASYGVADTAQLPESFPFGTNQAGRAAENKKIVHLENIPENYMNITSTTGALQPKHIVILPLLFNHVVEGVIEVAAINPFSKAALKLMEASIPAIAIALQASKSRGKLQEMLEETQAQTEELQAQQSELENLNEELEVQAQKLQASEEELRVQQEELQQTNNELVQQTSLLEEKNKEVNRKAEELVITTRYKSEFLANMSHELRTPLNSILLLSRLLSDNTSKNLNSDQVEYAQVILSSGNGLLGLIDEILDLSKIEAGKMQLDYQTIEIKDIVLDLLGLFKQLALQKKIDFDIVIDKDVPPLIETDKQRVEQILKNLLSNAFKFTHIGEVKMEININPTNTSFISIAVKDSGIGISAAQQPLIFEAFQQADGSTRRKYGGTGLGLSISRELAKLLGGEILLSSEENKGSVFTLNLPLKRASHIEDDFTEAEVEVVSSIPKPSETATSKDDSKYLASHIPNNIADDRATTSPSDKCILIVEDDTNFAKSLLDFTRKQGYKGIIAVRGDEGLELARQFLPIGILLDIQLPVISGWEVMDALKKDPRTKNIPVHIMSSHAVESESLSAGAINFINKPMVYDQMPEIFKRIEAILSKKSNKVLIIEENNVHSKALAFYLESFKIKTRVLSTMEECLVFLQSKEVGCVILDMGIPDQAAYEKLEETKKIPGLENLPIIIFTGKNLSKVEEQRIKKYADSIIVKTAYSYQRILDEISLFLNLVGDPLKAGPKINDYKKLSSLGQVLNNKTVLVVDDDVRNIFSLTKTLENLKMHVLTAIDGNEALNMLREHPEINLVLLDMMMPQMDGYETASRIRKDLQWKNLSVIAVTAKAMTGDREKCIKAGASDYITKPVDIDQLLSLMRVWLYDRAS